MISPYFMCSSFFLLSVINEALGKSAKFLNAAVAEERPPAANVLAALDVNVDDGDGLFIDGGLVEMFALWTCDETAAPELNAVGLSR